MAWYWAGDCGGDDFVDVWVCRETSIPFRKIVGSVQLSTVVSLNLEINEQHAGSSDPIYPRDLPAARTSLATKLHLFLRLSRRDIYIFDAV